MYYRYSWYRYPCKTASLFITLVRSYSQIHVSQPKLGRLFLDMHGLVFEDPILSTFRRGELSLAQPQQGIQPRYSGLRVTGHQRITLLGLFRNYHST
jgi:hypothetical protein